MTLRNPFSIICNMKIYRVRKDMDNRISSLYGLCTAEESVTYPV